MPIKRIHLKMLRNGEYIQFSNDFLEIVNRNNIAALNAAEPHAALAAATVQIEALFKNPKNSPLTQELITVDTRRDNAITGIKGVIAMHALHFDAALITAANILLDDLKRYGSRIAKENYQSETSLITNLVTDWTDKPDLEAAIATLQLTEWVAELNAANIAFNNLYLNRTQQLAALSPTNIKTERKEALQQYYKLRDIIDAGFTIHNGAAPFDKTIKECNALIEQYNALIVARKKMNVEDKHATPLPVKE